MILSMLGAMMLASGSAFANSPSFLTVNSPDHPSTWVAGAHKEIPTLRWDSTHHMLVADVKYSTKDYADSVNPAESDYHALTFPNVRLASNGNDLLATNHIGETAKIGRIENGFFGKSVVLDNGVDLNVHREKGLIYASLTYNALEKE